MAKYKLVFERGKCISSLACVAIDSETWKVNADGKPDVSKAKKKGDTQELEFDSEEDFKKFKQAASSCPVNAIHIEDLEKGKKLI